MRTIRVIETEYGKMTLMPTKNNEKFYDLYDEAGNFIDEVETEIVEENEDDDESLAIALEEILDCLDSENAGEGFQELEEYYGDLDDNTLSSQGLEIVCWPESQELMEIPNYRKHSQLINSEEGINEYGSSAYVVEKCWLDKQQKHF